MKDLHGDEADSKVESHVIRNQGRKTKSDKVTPGSEEEKIENLKQRIKKESSFSYSLEEINTPNQKNHF